jgi:hypothetical protein
LLAARLTTPQGIVGEAAGHIDRILGRSSASFGSTLQTVAAPTDLPGGTLSLGQLLQKRCLEHGGRLFADGLQYPFKELTIGFNGISGRLATGELISAKVGLVSLDESSIATAFPDGSPLRKRFQPQASRPLLRLSLVVRARGIPLALGTFALIRCVQPLWLERRRIDDEQECLSIFWRSDDSDPGAQTKSALRELERVVPFYERHVIDTSTAAQVPDHSFAESPASVALSWRTMRARGPLLGACGAEGAALVATALADRVLKMSGRKSPPHR